MFRIIICTTTTFPIHSDGATLSCRYDKHAQGHSLIAATKGYNVALSNPYAEGGDPGLARE